MVSKGFLEVGVVYKGPVGLNRGFTSRYVLEGFFPLMEPVRVGRESPYLCGLGSEKCGCRECNLLYFVFPLVVKCFFFRPGVELSRGLGKSSFINTFSPLSMVRGNICNLY